MYKINTICKLYGLTHTRIFNGIVVKIVRNNLRAMGEYSDYTVEIMDKSVIINTHVNVLFHDCSTLFTDNYEKKYCDVDEKELTPIFRSLKLKRILE